MTGNGNHVNWNRTDQEKQVSRVLPHMWNIDWKKNDMSVKQGDCLCVGTNGRRKSEGDETLHMNSWK
jgi:hypothetical protein